MLLALGLLKKKPQSIEMIQFTVALAGLMAEKMIV
jgi:hypothetical protein